MKKLLSIIFLTACLSTPALAGSLKLGTYYPAPYGAFDRLQLTPLSSALTGACSNIGETSIDSSRIMMFCQDPDGDGNGAWGGIKSWTATTDASSNPILYPINTDANLRVGLGTTAPEFKLSLDQDGGILATGTYGSGLTYPASAEGGGARLVWYPNKAAFRAGTVTGTHWDDSNIGNHSLAANTDTTASGNFSAAFGLGATAQAYGSAVFGMYNTILGDPTSSIATDPILQIGNGSDSANRSTALTILKNGKMGIGTDTVADPNEAKINDGRILIEMNETEGESHLCVYKSNFLGYLGESQGLLTGGRSENFGAGSDNIFELGSYNQPPTLYVDGTQQFIGIKTASPGAEMDVTGTVQATAMLYRSDERLKTEIRPLAPVMDKLKQIHGVRFQWKNSGKNDIGLTAQDVEKVFPELVQTNPETGLKSVEYGNFIALLIEAVKEQHLQIQRLKYELDILESKKGGAL